MGRREERGLGQWEAGRGLGRGWVGREWVQRYETVITNSTGLHY